MITNITYVKLPIPQELKMRVATYLKTTNLGKRGEFDGTFDNQFTGMVGEVMAYEYLSGKRYEFRKDEDDGVDIGIQGKLIDVKTMLRSVDVRPHFVNNFVASQLKYKADALVFCSINKKTSTLEICGWIAKSDFSLRAILHKKDTERFRDNGTKFKLQVDTYEIGNEQLNDINTLKQ